MSPICFVRDVLVHAFERGTPPPPRSIGIISLEEFGNLIYGVQQVRGKILSPKELRAVPAACRFGSVLRKGIPQSRLCEHRARTKLWKSPARLNHCLKTPGHFDVHRSQTYSHSQK